MVLYKGLLNVRGLADTDEAMFPSLWYLTLWLLVAASVQQHSAGKCKQGCSLMTSMFQRRCSYGAELELCLAV